MGMLDQPDQCAICGERIPPFGSENAEMYDPKTDEGGVVHAQCGLSKGWEIA